jgi:alpha-1,2-mannosyltransferase
MEWRTHGPRPAPTGHLRALRTLAPPLGLGLLPLALMAIYLAVVLKAGLLGVDFHDSFWPAARAVLHGRSPYPPLDAHVLAQRSAFVYPPIVAIVIAPFGLLPVGLATAIAVVLAVAALPATLWVLGVRDWRCYTVAIVSPPMLSCIQTAALSSLLALLVALAWRARAKGWTAPVLIVVMIAAKLFLWPMLIWLALVRGVRCALWTATATGLLVLAPWLLGFPGGHRYARLLSMLTDIEGRHAYTIRALLLSLGTGTHVAEAVAIVAGGAVLLAAAALRTRPDAELRMLTLVLLAALLLSPIVWAHYLLILLPPVAIASRRLSTVWLVPWALWFAGGTWTTPSTAEIAVALTVMAVVTALVVRGGRGSPLRAR